MSDKDTADGGRGWLASVRKPIIPLRPEGEKLGEGVDREDVLPQGAVQ